MCKVHFVSSTRTYRFNIMDNEVCTEIWLLLQCPVKCDRLPCLETPFGRPVLEKNYCVTWLATMFPGAYELTAPSLGVVLHINLAPELPWVLKGVAEMLSGLLPQWWDSLVFRCGHPQLHFRLTIPVSLECTGPKRYKSCFDTLCSFWAADFSCGPSSWKHCAYHFLNHEQLYLENHATFKNATCTITYCEDLHIPMMLTS